ncbi:hypothetical protein [Sinorhizobium alkalisoli]|uniref:hypothetical protein n=1 Tax=Sinorhizobium alkalisoli TaxID=1752398 RepID=UPI00178C5FF1|nr:hypothetical protein [Sinorhizobium alkalisoli]
MLRKAVELQRGAIPSQGMPLFYEISSVPKVIREIRARTIRISPPRIFRRPGKGQSCNDDNNKAKIRISRRDRAGFFSLWFTKRKYQTDGDAQYQAAEAEEIRAGGELKSCNEPHFAQ